MTQLLFARLLRIKINQRALSRLPDLFVSRIISRIRGTSGCRLITLLQDRIDPEQVISLTLWENREIAVKYDNSGVFADIMREINQFYIGDSSEWKLQLSAEQRLEYVPVPEEPEITYHCIETQQQFDASAGDDNPIVTPELYVRMVNQKIAKERREDFKQAYQDEILPALADTEGCRSAYLLADLEHDHQFISMTVWSDQQAAERYERSGRFREMIDRIKKNLPQLAQWKFSMSMDPGRVAKTSEDLQVEHCRVVIGEAFA